MPKSANPSLNKYLRIFPVVADLVFSKSGSWSFGEISLHIGFGLCDGRDFQYKCSFGELNFT